MAAASVGLGNLWRFPYMAGENGGAAFVLAYLIALFLIAVPIMMLEVASGRLAHGGTVRTFDGVTRLGVWYGWFVVGLTAVITSYYLVITGWTLGFLTAALARTITDFKTFTQGYNSVWFFAGTAILTGILNWRGLAVIETLSKILIPLLGLMIVGLVVYATQLDGWSQATDFLFAWSPEPLARADLWFFAFGQAFFTVAIGQGYLVTYGSYIPAQSHIPRASLIVTLIQAVVAILAGLMIFPVVFSHGIDPAQGSKLAFRALPEAFRQITGGVWLALAFFFLFFAAALSSSLAGMKVVVASLAERFGMSTLRSVVLATSGLLILGLPSALSYTPAGLSVGGKPLLDVIDQIAGTNTVLISGVTGAGLLCWTISRARILKGLGARSQWWAWRIMLVGRSVPFAAALLLTWRYAIAPEG